MVDVESVLIGLVSGGLLVLVGGYIRHRLTLQRIWLKSSLDLKLEAYRDLYQATDRLGLIVGGMTSMWFIDPTQTEKAAVNIGMIISALTASFDTDFVDEIVDALYEAEGEEKDEDIDPDEAARELISQLRDRSLNEGWLGYYRHIREVRASHNSLRFITVTGGVNAAWYKVSGHVTNQVDLLGKATVMQAYGIEGLAEPLSEEKFSDTMVDLMDGLHAAMMVDLNLTLKSEIPPHEKDWR